MFLRIIVFEKSFILLHIQLISHKRYFRCTLIQWRLSIYPSTGSCKYLFREIPSTRISSLPTTVLHRFEKELFWGLFLNLVLNIQDWTLACNSPSHNSVFQCTLYWGTVGNYETVCVIWKLISSLHCNVHFFKIFFRQLLNLVTNAG